ncbi:MAG: hypothetical protein M9924_11400 [Rhizobiaceae bacterium]|nr:hypothetical protein [Rhizobiaceae bacterium]
MTTTKLQYSQVADTSTAARQVVRFEPLAQGEVGATAAGVEIEKGFYALGGSVASNAVSWMPADFGGHLPIQAYLIVDDDEYVLIDTGVAVHRQTIMDALSRLVGTRKRGRIMLTRREPDVLTNLPAIANSFKISGVFAGGELNPLDYFDSMDEASTYALMRSIAKPQFEVLRPGSIITLGERKLEFLRTSLKVLATNWIYEHTSKTLFSSDSWAFVTSSRETAPFRADLAANDSWLSTTAVENYLARKFDWMVAIDTTPLRQDLQEVFEAREIKRICPSSGAVIEGSDLVERFVKSTLDAMRGMSKRKWESALKDFEFPPDLAVPDDRRGSIAYDNS